MKENVQELEHEKLRIKIEAIKAQQETEFFMMNLTLKEIKKEVSATLEQAKKTNGRVTQLESDYIVISTLRKHKWLVLLVSIGIFKIYELIDLQWIYQKIISLF